MSELISQLDVNVLFNILTLFVVLLFLGMVGAIVVLVDRVEKLKTTNDCLQRELKKRFEQEGINHVLNDFKKSALRKMGVKDENLLNRHEDYFKMNSV